MTHDPVCLCAGVCDPPRQSCSDLGQGGCGCECSGIAMGRADEQQRHTTIIKRAVIETLRYLADPGIGSWRSDELADWADMVENQPDTYACCPFCQEIGCDEDCPLRQTRQQPDGWPNITLLDDTAK